MFLFKVEIIFEKNKKRKVIQKKKKKCGLALVADFENLLQPSYFSYFNNWLQWLI